MDDDRLETAIFIGVLALIVVIYMIGRMRDGLLNAWDDAVVWLTLHRFKAGLLAGVTVSVIVTALV